MSETIYNLYEAKTSLSRLVDRAAKQSEGLTVVTRDRLLEPYGVNILWG
jgi:hypothetical protein